MSFLAEFKAVADQLKAEGHTLATKAENLFGHTEKLIQGIAAELRPQIAADAKAVAEEVASAAKVDTQALAAEVAKVLAPEILKALGKTA